MDFKHDNFTMLFNNERTNFYKFKKLGSQQIFLMKIKYCVKDDGLKYFEVL